MKRRWHGSTRPSRSNRASRMPSTTELVALFHLHRFDEVFALSDRMNSLGLSSTVTEWNVSLVHLLTGNLEAGWRGHQTRLKLPSARHPQFQQPMWLGEESIAGKTILVAADEGLGDTIHFVRYVPMLAERGARVILVVQDPLHRLMSTLERCIPLRSGIGDGHAAGFRFALPDIQPAARLQDPSRYDPLGTVSARPSGQPCPGLGESSWSSHQASGRPGLVRRSTPRER